MSQPRRWERVVGLGVVAAGLALTLWYLLRG